MPKVISFHYTLRDKSGTVLDSSQGAEPLLFMEGASQIIPGLESQLLPMSVGDKKKVEVKAADAYGEQDPELKIEVERSKFPKDAEIEEGMHFQMGGGDHAPVVRVVAVSSTTVTVDGNHPLAGQDLFFEVEIVESRAASLEEIKHGHAHGPGGHHH